MLVNCTTMKHARAKRVKLLFVLINMQICDFCRRCGHACFGFLMTFCADPMSTKGLLKWKEHSLNRVIPLFLAKNRFMHRSLQNIEQVKFIFCLLPQIPQSFSQLTTVAISWKIFTTYSRHTVYSWLNFNEPNCQYLPVSLHDLQNDLNWDFRFSS